jgi:hypothetical protein
MGHTVSTYVHVVDGTIIAGSETTQPRNLIRTADGASVLWSPYITPAELAACGWLAVADTARPADTPTQTTDRFVELVAGQPTVVWHVRNWTPDELTARARDANRDILTALTKAQTALTTNSTFLALGTPTNAQAVTQTRALTRQINGVLRYLLGQLHGELLDNVNDT